MTRTRGWVVVLGVLGVGVLAALLVPWPVPPYDRVAHSLCDLAHAPVFAVLAFAVRRVCWPPDRPAGAASGAAVWIGLSLAGGAIELAQGQLGRQASWQDALSNSLGAAAGVLLAESARRSGGRARRRAADKTGTGTAHGPSETIPGCKSAEPVPVLCGGGVGRRAPDKTGTDTADSPAEPIPGCKSAEPVPVLSGGRAGLRLAAVLAVGLAWWPSMLVLYDAWRQSREFPRLGSFESALELSRWSAQECRIERRRGEGTHGDWVLRLDLAPARYTGASLAWPPHDWSSYLDLVFDARVEGDAELVLTVKIQDAEHDGEVHDRFQRRVWLGAGWQEVRIALSQVASAPRDRRLDLRRVTLLQFFTGRLRERRAVSLDNVRLE
ncbi:MAG TPA: carbohydrate binding domain-containing protein [Planctomycetaceae bacterium]|nr:carbohydrate binding domain-containing protein [Planctomycetaceae bacterium]